MVTNRLGLPAELIAETYRQRWVIEMFFRVFKQFLGCKHLFSGDHNGAEIQAYCATIVCMLILISTGEKPNRAMHQMVWYDLIGMWDSLLRGWCIREGRSERPARGRG